MDNQLKTLSNRKAYKEGHAADDVADKLSLIVLILRLRRRGERQIDSVPKMMNILIEGRGK